MSDAASSDWGVFPRVEAEERRAPTPKANWPLMGDVLASRGGVPEHLIQWQRAMGEHDPEPLL
ncbi:hypothetical protein [Boseongicola aestuarii]|jgi:hypothetical protein|uniref:hypothetical protein n=1 Tax=Boseongicola aestuarii TaxID=1470561 RepID=UPI000BB45163|nr:hypothetical protein [Boseongicola aestuarii]